MKNSAAVALITVVLCCQSLAVADEGNLPACVDDPTCVSLFERAKQQSKDGNLDEAQRLYRQAYDLRADPRLLFSIARVLQKQSKWKEAAAFYQNFIDSPLHADEQKQKAAEYVQECRRQTAEQDKASAVEAERTKRQATIDAASASDPTPGGHGESAGGRAAPVYKKWWFWVAIGGVAVAAAGITAGVVLGTQNSSQNPASLTSTRMAPVNSLVIVF